MVWNAAWRLSLPGAQFQGVKDVTDNLPDGGLFTGVKETLAKTKRGNWQAAIGVYDFDVVTGATGQYDIFTVTGDVILQVFGICETTVTEAGATALVSLGVAGALETFIADTPGTDLTEGDLWHDATPTTQVENVDIYSKTFIASDGQDIQMNIKTEALTAGKVNFYCFWKPLSADGNVVAA